MKPAAVAVGLAGGLGLAALVALAACGANHAGDADAAPGGAPADTVRGVVAVTGADPLTRVEIRAPGAAPVVVTGPLADTLRRAAGLEVRVAGARSGGELEARAFRVRGLEAMPAADGILELDGDAAVLVTADGARLRYPAAPAGLRVLAGRRVWIAGEPGAEPRQWGVLDG